MKVSLSKVYLRLSKVYLRLSKMYPRLSKVYRSLSKTLYCICSFSFFLVNCECSCDADDYTLLSQCLDDFSASSSKKNCVKNYLARRYKENGKNTPVSLYLSPVQAKRIKVVLFSASYVSLFNLNSHIVSMPEYIEKVFLMFVLGTKNRVQENFVSSVFQPSIQE